MRKKIQSLLFHLLFLLVGSLLIVKALISYNNLSELKKNGQHITGMIVENEKISSSDNFHYVSYAEFEYRGDTFRIKTGNTYNKEEPFAINEEVDILLNEKNPQDSVINVPYDKKLYDLLLFSGSFSILVAVIGLYNTIKK